MNEYDQIVLVFTLVKMILYAGVFVALYFACVGVERLFQTQTD